MPIEKTFNTQYVDKTCIVDINHIRIPDKPVKGRYALLKFILLVSSVYLVHFYNEITSPDYSFGDFHSFYNLFHFCVSKE